MPVERCVCVIFCIYHHANHGQCGAGPCDALAGIGQPNNTPAATAPIAAAAPVGTRYAGSVDLDCDVLVLGGGPGGYSAAFRAADLWRKVIIVERYATLGGVCLSMSTKPLNELLILKNRAVSSRMSDAAHSPSVTSLSPT